MNGSIKFELREQPCSVCDSVLREHLGWRGGTAHHDGQGERIEIVRCRECTHLYPHPMPFPRGDLASLYTDTDEYFSAHDVEEKKRLGGELLKMIEKKLGHRGSLLDLGCGRGELMWAAREAGWKAEGVDPSPAHLEWARINLGIEGLLGTIEEAKFPSAHFDAITMGGVIEHLYDPYGTLREVWRVLKPGGVFYFDAPNEDGLYTRIGNIYQRAQGRDWVVNLAPTFAPYHVQGFNRQSIQRLLQRVGFEVESMKIYGQVSPMTGKTSLRKRIEHRAGQLVNWVGNLGGAGIYMYVWTKKPTSV
jgi:SAM-dependent methyltransferase